MDQKIDASPFSDVPHAIPAQETITMFPWMEDELQRRRRQGLHRVRRRLGSPQGARVHVGARELVNFASNDYLGLASHPDLAKAASRAADRYGCGAGSSALISGHLPPLRELEEALAEWQGTEAALVFTSGFVANLALVSTLVGSEDVIFSDQYNHASLIDGCRQSRAQTYIYRHGDANHLADLLRNVGSNARRRLVVTDSVFSMDGTIAPLADLLELAERYDAMLLVDEAHATGLMGPTGRGATELVPSDAPGRSRLIKVGTLSKALGAQGGFVCGTHVLCDWLVNHARPYIFSTALAPPVAAAARQAIALVVLEPHRREHLHRLASELRDALRGLGYDIGRSICHIIPVILGEPDAAVQLSQMLEEIGMLVPAIRPPSVPVGTARLRISLMADHTDEDVRSLLKYFPPRNAS